MKSRITNSMIVGLLMLPLLATGQERSEPREPGDRSFVAPGTWWNLYFSKENNPLQRGSSSVNAVKILESDQDRPSWIRIKFPKNREEHFSILRAAAKAHDDDSLSMAEALTEWEKSVSDWRVMWVNLRFVVHMTRVGQSVAPTEAGDGSFREGAG